MKFEDRTIGKELSPALIKLRDAAREAVSKRTATTAPCTLAQRLADSEGYRNDLGRFIRQATRYVEYGLITQDEFTDFAARLVVAYSLFADCEKGMLKEAADKKAGAA